MDETSIDLGLIDDSEDVVLKDKKSKFRSVEETRVTSIAEVLKMH